MKRLLVVQPAGDFRQAYMQRLRSGVEYGFGRCQMLDDLGRLSERHGEVGLLSCVAPAYSMRLPNHVTVMGAGLRRPRRLGPAIRMIEAFDPSHLVVHAPLPRLLRWGVGRGRAVACVLDQTVDRHPMVPASLPDPLAALLNHPQVSLVANHGHHAARSLVDRGVRAHKVLAWTFERGEEPHLPAVREGPGRPPYRLFYAGPLNEERGVGDMLGAMALLRGRLDIRLDLAGGGEIEMLKAKATALGLLRSVRFLGLVPSKAMGSLMRAADLVLLPCRHRLTEAMPHELGEALGSRTPLIASDHPLFAAHLDQGVHALLFKAAAPGSLAQAIETLLGDRRLYARLSRDGHHARTRLRGALSWGTMIERWIEGSGDASDWLAAHSLALGGSAALDGAQANDKREA